MALPLLGFTGAAIDYGFATYLETKLQAATDATALALCQTPMTTTNAALQLQASTMMTGYMGATSLTVDPLTVTANPRQITLTTHVVSPVFFGRITGGTAPRPGGSARCATPIPKTFEIALVLDNTGSMAASSGGQSKLQAVQAAATNFVDYVYTNAAFATGTKIAIVPFAGAVAVDPAAYRYATWIDQNAKSAFHWTNVTSPGSAGFTNRFGIFSALQSAYSGWGWAGCLETLPYPLNVQDGAPTSSNPNSYYVPLFAPDEPGDGSTGFAGYNNNSALSFNSYIDDSTNANSCPSQSQANTSFAAAEGRACKYVNARDASPTTANPYTGIPNGPNFGCTTQPAPAADEQHPSLKSRSTRWRPRVHQHPRGPDVGMADAVAEQRLRRRGALRVEHGEQDRHPDDRRRQQLGDERLLPFNQSMYFAAGYLKNVDGPTPNPRLPPGNQNVSNTANARAALDALTALACSNAKAPASRSTRSASACPRTRSTAPA